MNPDTSTKAGSVPTTGGTNPLYLMGLRGTSAARISGISWSDFTLRATSQGHLHNGLLVGYADNPNLSDLEIDGIPGNSGIPPGETFAFNVWQCRGATLDNVVVQGHWVTASGLGLNSSTSTTVNGGAFNKVKYGAGITQWQCANTTLNGVDLSLNRKAFNSEMCTGFLTMNNCDFRGLASTGPHITIDGYAGSMKVTIADPVLEPSEGPLRIKLGATYTYNGVTKPNAQLKSDIKVLINGKDVSGDSTKVKIS